MLSASQQLTQSLFVEFALSAAENVRSVRVRTTNYAFELDNLAWSYASAPNIVDLAAIDPALSVTAPAGALLLAMGVAGMLVGIHRRPA